MARTLSAAGLTALLAVSQSASADPIPYPSSGSYNPTTYTFTAASSGDVISYIVGGFGAGYTNELGLLINGVASAVGFGLNNHTSAVGDAFNFGHADAGDTLVFILHNLSLGKDAYSDPALNSAYEDPGYTGGHNHIYSTAYTATAPVFPGVPVGTYVAFEDIPFPGADFNYDDESFVFSNVRTAPGGPSVPEPGVLALLGLGLGCLARMRSKGKREAAA